jgi:hypothetical protein
MAENEKSEKRIEIELDGSYYRVTLHTIEFERDNSGQVERVVYHFHLHFGAGWTTMPVTVTEFDPDSMDKNFETASDLLYEMIACLAEAMRRKGDYPVLSFK